MAGAAAVGVWAVAYTHELVVPFLFAAVLAILFTPVVEWMTRHRMPRVLAAVLVLLGLVVLAVISTVAVVQGIAQEAPGSAA
ncbi:MAG TPA: AI-2E family transporter [Jiangellaceae bacterium]|nr:AI-2E family transporter [Jiangellaceae bacterium]